MTFGMLDAYMKKAVAHVIRRHDWYTDEDLVYFLEHMQVSTLVDFYEQHVHAYGEYCEQMCDEEPTRIDIMYDAQRVADYAETLGHVVVDNYVIHDVLN